jgi:DNA-directed RNA polymerase specialized sigma24 family protein
MRSDPFSGVQFNALFRQLTRFLEQHGCRDPENAAQEVIIRGLERRANVTRPQDGGLRKYLFGIARMVALECLKPKHTREHQVDPVDSDQWSSPPRDVERALDARREVEWAMRRIDPDDARLLEEYIDGDDRPALAAARGVSAQTLRVQVHRIRRRVQGLIEQYRAGAARR